MTATHGVYVVTGERHYRGHGPGTRFVSRIDRNAEHRAVLRGDVRLLKRVTPALVPGSYQLPKGWDVSEPDTERTGFVIDGRDYPIPSIFELTMGEAQTLYDYCGYTLEDFVPPVPGEPDEKRLRQVKDPAFKRAMVHIAYQRGNPNTPKHEVASLVDGVQMFDMVAAMYADEDENPTPVSQNEPSNTKNTNGHSNSGDSGRPSTSNSGLPDEIPAPTGTSG